MIRKTTVYVAAFSLAILPAVSIVFAVFVDQRTIIVHFYFVYSESVFDGIDLEPLVCPRCGEQNIPIMSYVCPHSYCLGCMRQRNENRGGKEESLWLSCPICRAPDAFCSADTGRRVNLKASQLMETAVALRMKLSCAEEAHEEVEARWRNEMKEMQQWHESAMLDMRRRDQSKIRELEAKLAENEEEIKRLTSITQNKSSLV